MKTHETRKSVMSIILAIVLAAVLGFCFNPLMTQAKQSKQSGQSKQTKQDKQPKQSEQTTEEDEDIYSADQINYQTVDHLLNQNLDNKIVILHTTDVHGALIKLANVASLKKELEKKGADVVLIDGGDFSYAKEHKEKPEAPKEYEYLNDTKGLGAITVMNAMGYDYATIGNHEYEFGASQLKDNLGYANFQVMSANIYSNDSTRADGLAYAPNFVYQNKDNPNVKIGFFGLTAIETRNQKGKLEGTTIVGESEVSDKNPNPMFKIAKEQVEALKNKKVDTIIAVTHLGVKLKESRNKYLENNRSIDMYNYISKAYENSKNPIDLILDGHSHNSLTSGRQGEPIMSGGIRMDGLGVVIIDNNDKAKPIKESFLIKLDALEKGIKADPEITTLVQMISSNKIDLKGFTKAQHEAFLRGETVPTLPDNAEKVAKTPSSNNNRDKGRNTKNRNR
ncbi:MAG: bifunctional metallophosphatase/5'-nucleotidase [Eubacterium sp.]|nr:bifunctional metallophosphatase/5'-nucleotidase [Eubacterium sp.]